MILRDNEIQSRFKDLLSAHTRVDIATAWATCGEHVRMLVDATKRERMPVEVRAIVGTAGNATRPDALETLYRITKGSLRIIWNENQPRLFHPSCTCSASTRTGAHSLTRGSGAPTLRTLGSDVMPRRMKSYSWK